MTRFVLPHSRLSIRQKLFLGLLSSCLLIVAIGVTAIRANSSIIATLQGTDQHFRETVAAATKVSSEAKRANAYLISHLNLEDSSDYQSFETSYQSLLQAIEQLESNVSSVQSQSIVREMQDLSSRFYSLCGEILGIYRQDRQFNFEQHENLIMDIYETSSRLRSLGVELAKFETNFLNRQEAITAASDASDHIKRAENHLILYLNLHHAQDREKFQQLYQQLQENIYTLENRASNEDIKAIANEMRHYSKAFFSTGELLIKSHDSARSEGNVFDFSHNRFLLKNFQQQSQEIQLLGEQAAQYNLSLEIAPKLAALADARQLQQMIYFGVAATLLISLWGSFQLVRAIVSPIKQLKHAAEQIGRGHLDVRIENSSKDELGQLAASFNDMAEKLRSSATTSLDKAYLDKILFSMNDALIVITGNGKIKTANRAALSLLNFRESELIGQDIQLILPVKIKLALQNARVDEEALFQQGIETCYSNKQGNDIPVFLSAAAMYDENRSLQGIVCVAQDIRTRKEAEQQLLAQEHELSLILNTMVDGVLSIDQFGNVLSANRSAERIFGFSSGQLQGHNITPLIYIKNNQSQPQSVARLLANARRLQPDQSGEILARRKNGETFPMRFSIAQLPDSELPSSQPEQEQKRFIISCVDITLEKEQEEQLRRKLKMDALGKLTGGIAHDYNNMLGVILGYSELLINKLAAEDKLLHYATAIKHAGERGTKLTEKLLAFARKKSAEPKAININQCISDLAMVLERTLTASIRLQLELSRDIWLSWIDAGDLEDAILNLGINAAHAMKDSGELRINTRNLTLNAEEALHLSLPAGDYILLSIVDNGCGMDSALLEHIFDPFFSTKGDQGSGLGLSQVYGFIKRSNGQIKVYSEPGQGTRFNLYFPRYCEEPSAAAQETMPVSAGTRGDEYILVVDDEPALLELCQEILSNNGYRVICAEHGEQALALLQQQHIDLMISDVILPGINGYQLSEQARQLQSDLAIQLISGYSETRHQDEVDPDLRAKLLNKPFSSTQLLERVRSILDKRRQAQSVDSSQSV